MTFDEFKASMTSSTPPATLPPLLKALWHDGNGDWEAAHQIAQSKEGNPAYDRIHAYLHRVEGDEWNAGYWYRRAGSKVFAGSLQEEWTALVQQHVQ